MCRDQGLLGVPFKGWNRLIRPLALQDLNKVPVVVGFHYYTFFNWAINGKVVQLFLKKSQNQWLSHLRQKEWGVIVSDFILVLWTLYSDHKAKGKLLFFIEKVITVLVMPFRADVLCDLHRAFLRILFLLMSKVIFIKDQNFCHINIYIIPRGSKMSFFSFVKLKKKFSLFQWIMTNITKKNSLL